MWGTTVKIVSFIHAGQSGFGILKGKGIIDIARRWPGRTLNMLLAEIDPWTQFADYDADLAFDDVTLLPPVPDNDRIIGVGLNYRSHIEETGIATPDYPMLFSRFASSVVGHGAPLVVPKLSKCFDFEGELAIVIGKAGRHIPVERAIEHVAGYSVFNDGSIRDFQRHTTQILPGKNFDSSASFGPWLVTCDEVGDIKDLQLTTRLNGEIVQQARLDDLLFGVPDLIAYISRIWEVRPGDVISTGTPGGIGATRKPPLWMKAGDRIEIEIDRLGTLSNPVLEEAP